MIKHEDVVLSTLGEPVTGVVVTVFTYPALTPVDLYEDDEVTLIASCETNTEGEYYFNVPAGAYTLVYTYNGAEIDRREKLSVGVFASDLQGNGGDVDAVGFRGIPVRSFSANTSTVLADVGKQLLHPSSDNNARVVTIDMTLTYEAGSAINVVNRSAISITITGSTPTNLILCGTTTTGARTLAQNGMALLDYVDGVWIASGTGLT